MCVLVFAHQLPLASCLFEIKGPPILLASCKHDLLLNSTQHDVYGRFGFYNIYFIVVLMLYIRAIIAYVVKLSKISNIYENII